MAHPQGPLETSGEGPPHSTRIARRFRSVIGGATESRIYTIP